jgi:phospholipid transport system substrate-binding protein
MSAQMPLPKKYSFLIHVLILSVGITYSSISPAQTPNELIDTSVKNLSPLIEEGHNYYKEDPQRLYANMGDLLSTFFDFDGFAKGVMGKKGAAASKDQKRKFSDELKRSLVKTFADGLMSLGSYTIKVNPAQQSKPGKAKVTMEVKTTRGENHEMSYSLSQSKDGQWRVRNVVFDGVNLGLAFRSQFTNKVTTLGSVDAAIESWEIVVE